MAVTERDASGTGRSRLPADPGAFVAEAERATNEVDVAVLDGMFAADAVYENTADGVFERYRGHEQVVNAWKALLTTGGAVGLTVRKTLLSAEGEWIVNDWRGTMGGRPTRGVELWHFDAEGRVDHQRTYSTLSARPAGDLRAKLRAGLNYPAFALRLILAQRRFGARATNEES